MAKPESLFWLCLFAFLALLLPARAQVQVKGKFEGIAMKSGYEIIFLPSFNNTQLVEEMAHERKRAYVDTKTADRVGSVEGEETATGTGEWRETVWQQDGPHQSNFKSGHNRIGGEVGREDNETEDEGEMESDGGAFTFGKEIDVHLDIASDGTWFDVRDGGRVWRLGLRSNSAVSLNLLFDMFWLPPGGELYIRGETASLGAFVAESSNRPSMKLATMPLPGRLLDIEYYSPPGTTVLPLLRIAAVIHGYRLPIYEKSASSFCHVNAPSCEQGSVGVEQSKTVVVLMTENGKRFCSGCMMNNAAMNGRQFFLTARHCVSGPGSDPSYNILGFNFQAASCNGSRIELPIRESASGLRPLVNSTESDFALLEVEERIPDSYNVYMAGWSIHKTGPASAYGIHHPKGDVKKICMHDGLVTLTHWRPYRQPEKKNHWRVNGWHVGCTEHGSSGSPLFDERGLVIGQLHGGHSSCQQQHEDDYYGALWASFELGLATYLNPYNWTNLRSIEGAYLAGIRKGLVCPTDEEIVNAVPFPSVPQEQDVPNPVPDMVLPPSVVTLVPVCGSVDKPQDIPRPGRPLSVFDIVEQYDCHVSKPEQA